MKYVQACTSALGGVAQPTCKQDEVARWAEDIPVDKLPARFLGEFAFEALHVAGVGLGVARIVPPQRPHEDDCHKTRQEDDHHERVEDGEPVDLQIGRAISSGLDDRSL